MTGEFPEILLRYWDALDLLDADLAASCFAPGGKLTLGANRAVRGRDAIRRAFVQVFVEMEALVHRPVAVWRSGGVVVADADVQVRLEDGARLQFPATTRLWSDEERILDCRMLYYPDVRIEQPVLTKLNPRIIDWLALMPVSSRAIEQSL